MEKLLVVTTVIGLVSWRVGINCENNLQKSVISYRFGFILYVA